MRWLLGILIALTLLWFGYWYAGATVIQRQVDQIFAEAQARGYTAQKTGAGVAGFPNRFDLTLEGLKLADPVTGAGYEAPFLQVFAMTWKPWHVIAALPEAQVIRLPGQEIGLTGLGLKASLRAKPALDLPLAEARFAGQEIRLSSSQGWQTGAVDLVLALAQAQTGPADYALGLAASGVQIDPAFRSRLAALALPGLPASDLPETAGPLRANILLHLTAPLDRQAAQRRPQLTGFDIGELHLEWGAMTAEASGRLTADPQGQAEGEILLTLTGWDRLPALLVALGAVKPEIAPTVQSMLKALAGESGDPAVLKLPLKFDAGQMSLGPFPLGPAPLLRLPAAG